MTLPIWARGYAHGALKGICACALIITLLLGISGCNGGEPEPKIGAPSTNDERPNPNLFENAWVLQSQDPLHATPAYLTNGLIGLRFRWHGLGSPEPDSAFYAFDVETEGQERQISTSNPLTAEIVLGDMPLTAEQVKDWKQTLDMRSGVLETSYSFREGPKRANVTVRNVLHPSEPLMAQEIEIDVDRDLGFRIDCRESDSTAWNVRWFETGADMPESKFISVKPGEARHLSFTRMAVLKDASDSKTFAFPSFKEIQALRIGSANDDRKVDIEIDGPMEDQVAVRSFLFYLSQSLPKSRHVSSGSGLRVGPMGLSSTTYNGHVFWDADVWVFPALALLEPERASAIPAYRLAKSEAAKRNFKLARSWAKSPPNPKDLAAIDAVQYPWESSVSGLEVSPTETKQQHHITGTVLFGLHHAAALGLVEQSSVEAVGKKAANFYLWRSKVDTATRQRTLEQVVSPDEFYFGDDDRYTNAIAEWTINTFAPQSKTKFLRPTAEGGRPLNYGNDRGKGYKQASGVLAIYPLQDPETEKVARQMMDLYADKVIKNGPAMTDSVHATIWARLGETEKAYTTWRRSWQDFTKHPLLLFSEKRSKDETYFLTGAGGSLQTVLYGFLGFRLDLQKQPGAAWSTPLKNGYWLSVKPQLPKAWKRVTLKNFRVLGKRYTLIASHDDVRVIPGE